MKLWSMALATIAAGWCCFATSASAAPVTIGSPLTPSSETLTAGATGTYFNEALAEQGAHVTSPISGTIVRWRLGGAIGPFKLRVLRPDGGTTYTAVGSSALINDTNTGSETFATALPIQAGQSIGLDMTKGAKIGVFEDLSEHNGVADWSPPLAEHASLPYGTLETGLELSFNADVQPLPTIGGITPASGEIGGGSPVTITGTDFEGASAVKFGAASASSFAIDSESQITAVAPPSIELGKVPVTVTTAAGSASSAQTFAYEGCKVPKLNGKKLKAAKKKLKASDCKLGKVKKLNGASPKTGKVKSQSPKAGKVLAPGSRVNVRVG